MSKIKTILILCLLALPTGQIFAWGSTGHRIVAQVAYDNLNCRARHRIDRILGKHGIVYWANWADNIKSDTIYPNSHDWHYQDFEPNMTDSAVLSTLIHYPTVGGNLFRASDSLINLLRHDPKNVDALRFIKNLLLDNLLLVDVNSRAMKLHIATTVRRVVYILESNQTKDYSTLETVKGLFAGTKNDFITAVDENSIIIIKELGDETGEELQAVARTIIDSLAEKESDSGQAFRVAYGNPVSEIREVSRSYKEARMALDVGKIFFEGQDVIAYSQLGIGRLIYQLPIPLCKMFIREIFTEKSPDDFDEETLTTINKFFENSLNVSETSRQLYIHRNTLVYRLDKLQKSTGLDLRVFDDAITFKIALMVVRYMKYMEMLDY